MDMTESRRLRDQGAMRGGFAPVTPRTIADTGVAEAFLNALLLRRLYSFGDACLKSLVDSLSLPAPVVRSILQRLRLARMVERLGAASDAGDEFWTLTTAGRARAAEARALNAYLGPAPVSVESYRRSLAEQPDETPPDAARLSAVLGDLAIDPGTLDQLGVALTSGRNFIIHGPPGSGRSSLVGRLSHMLRESVWIPRAVLLGDQVMSLYDPACHEIVPLTNGGTSLHDPRWVRVRRPVVMAGSATTEDSFRLSEQLGLCALAAPLQIKSAHGILVLDEPRTGMRSGGALCRRLTSAIESGRQTLVTSDKKVAELPLKTRLVVVDSRSPSKGGYHRMGLRFGHRVSLAPLHPELYRQVLSRAAQAAGLPVDQVGVEYLCQDLHRRSTIPLLSSIPSELIRRISDQARWRAVKAEVNPDSLERAWCSLFGTSTRGPAA